MSTIIGIPKNKVIVSASSIARERLGLERVNEVYHANSDDAQTILAAMKNGAIYSTIATSYFSPAPEAARLYKWLSIETIGTEESRGGITKINASYVGLRFGLNSYDPGATTLFTQVPISAFPRALHRITPLDKTGYLINSFSQTVEFVSFSGIQNEILLNNLYGDDAPMPSTVAGISMIPSARSPYREETFIDDPNIFGGKKISGYIQYYGLVSQGIFIERYGQLARCSVTFSDKWEIEAIGE